MRAKCVSISPTAEQRMRMGRVAADAHEFALELGKTYMVVGVQFSVDSNVLGTGTWLHLVNEHGKLSWAPISLFEIVDGRASRYWRVDTTAPGQTRIWPDLLFRDYFHEDLGEGIPEAVAEFTALLQRLEEEYR